MAYKKICKVLIVDDEEVIRDFLTRLLTLEGMSARTAENGLKAIEMAKQEQFDLFFIDLRMPGIDGVETLKELKKVAPDSKYIMITGYSLDDLLKRLEGEDIEAIVTKPFEINEIIDILEGYLREKYPGDVVNILIVESEEIISIFFSKLLQNYNITTLKTGKEAMALLEQRAFDLIISDISLMDMSGVELYSKIREKKPDAKVILVTGDPKKTEDTVKNFLYNQIKEILK